MSDIREFLNRPLVMMATGVVLLLFAISWFSGGGIGIIAGFVMAVAGGYNVWVGFTRWQAERS